jgi:HK97 family phage prohead protease
MTDKFVRFSTDITAADAERRTIVGTVVPYGDHVGQTSLGPVRFQAGSISVPDTVKLVLEHDMKRPIGKASGFVDGPDRLVGSFRLSHTSAASDALVEASDGLRDGLSVGARIIESTVDDRGTMVVTAADLVEVSLVHAPAFSDAVVTQVAASDPDGDTPTESEEDIVEHETTEVEATEVVAAPEPLVEAARPTMPYITTQPRDVAGLTAGGMVMHRMKAQLGSQDSADVVRHVTAAVAKQDTDRDAGIVPVRYLREIIALVDVSRPFINSIDRQPLPDAGMSFKIPKVTTAVATAEQVSEFDELQSTQGQIQDITVDIKTFGGVQDVSMQLIDRSDPSYFDELLRQLARSFAHVTDKYAYDTVKGATSATESSGVGLYAATTKGISDSYGVMRFTPNILHVAPGGNSESAWLDYLQAEDDSGRPLYAAAAPQNAAGLVTQGSTNGTVAGLQLVVNPNIGTNEAARVFPSAFSTYYESAGAPVRVEIVQPDTWSMRVSVGGYVAIANKFPTAIRTLVVTS